MPTPFNARLQEVRDHYAAGDQSLAHRRLLDVILETGSLPLFRDTLAYADWLDADEGRATSGESTARALTLLETAAQSAPREVPTPSRILSTIDLGKQYARGGFTLSKVNLQLDAGRIIGLVGENGNGKTTLLRLIAGELKPDTGRVEYPFHSSQGDRYSLRSQLVYIEQRIPRWYGSLADNLRFVLAQHGILGDEAELRAELMVARLGLRPYRHLSWNSISSGYRTRFEIAKALLRRPQVLLLDEPLANLDIVAQQTLLQDLRFMAGSLTQPFGMLLSSQHIYEVEKVSDSIIFLKKGSPQYRGAEAEGSTAPLIIELETPASRDALAAALAGLPLENLQNNGGVFLLEFTAGAAAPTVLAALAAAGLDITYLRNISHSSRRFFLTRVE